MPRRDERPKIETIEDVHAVLDGVRETLEEIDKMDLNDPDAKILYAPLLQLRGELLRVQQNVERVMKERGLDGRL